MYTEYLFDQDMVTQLVAEKAASLKANLGMSDFSGYALSVINDRLRKDPLRYLDYGPYWWSLKRELVDAGYDYGSDDDPEIREVYCGRATDETIVMADTFRSMALEQYFVGTRTWMLKASSSEGWTLLDDDLESKVSSKMRQQ
jgi:hypothetical protein